MKSVTQLLLITTLLAGPAVAFASHGETNHVQRHDRNSHQISEPTQHQPAHQQEMSAGL